MSLLNNGKFLLHAAIPASLGVCCAVFALFVRMFTVCPVCLVCNPHKVRIFMHVLFDWVAMHPQIRCLPVAMNKVASEDPRGRLRIPV